MVHLLSVHAAPVDAASVVVVVILVELDGEIAVLDGDPIVHARRSCVPVVLVEGVEIVPIWKETEIKGEVVMACRQRRERTRNGQ